MKEIECFAFTLNIDEVIRRRSEIIFDTKKLSDEFIGIHPDMTGKPIVSFLFRSREYRDKVLEDWKSIYMTVRKEHKQAFIPEDYEEQIKNYDPFEGDDEASKMMQEVKEKIKEECWKEYQSKLDCYENEVQKLKAEISKLKIDLKGADSIARNKVKDYIALEKYASSRYEKYESKIKELENENRRIFDLLNNTSSN